jgi:CRP-like cAMP-binding protein
MEELIKKMKLDYDSLHPVAQDDFERLCDFLEFKHYKRKEIIRTNGVVEDKSRYIFEGVLGLYECRSGGPLCRTIYHESDTVCDFESYTTGEPSKFSLVALTECLVCELTKDQELKAIEAIPSFGCLAIRIYQRMMLRNSRWNDLLLQGDAEKYEIFQKLFPKYGVLAVKDIASLLNIPERSMFRLRGCK